MNKNYTPVFVYTKTFEVKDETLTKVMPLIPQTGTIYKAVRDNEKGGFMLLIPSEERQPVGVSGLPLFDLAGFDEKEDSEEWTYEIVQITSKNLLNLPLDHNQIRYLYKEKNFLKGMPRKKKEAPTPPPPPLDLKTKERMEAFSDSEGYMQTYFPDIYEEYKSTARALDYFLYTSDLEEIPLLRNLLYNNSSTDSDYLIGKIKESINSYHAASTEGEKRKALYGILVHVYTDLANL